MPMKHVDRMVVLSLLMLVGGLMKAELPASYPATSSQGKAAATTLSFDAHDGYFVRNTFEPKAEASFVAIGNQGAFDDVFGVAFVMGDKSHRLPTGAFDTKMVLAVIKRGKATWDFKVEGVTSQAGVLTVRYSAKSTPSDSAEYACPLIVSTAKGGHPVVEFVENGKLVKKVEFPATAPASSPATGPTTTSRPTALAPGDHLLELTVDRSSRSYLVHVPPGFDAKKPTPVVLIYHGAMTTAPIMVGFCGMNKKADSAGFVAVYPNGLMLSFNAWATPSPTGRPPDDVKFTAGILDDLATLMNVDARRVYATGMSNGAMMCYRLAAELSDRIAAIAPVAGTLCIDKPNPKRPVPVLHFHGTADTFVPFDGPNQRTPRFVRMKSVDDTVKTWVKLNGCPEEPKVTELPDTANDGTTVTRKVYGPGKDGAEVVLYVIKNGGHTWPGQNPVVNFLGKSTGNMVANDLIWEFFLKHPMVVPATQPATSSKPVESAFEIKRPRTIKHQPPTLPASLANARPEPAVRLIQ
jgi:polyhydroxybutyrate depolymerase